VEGWADNWVIVLTGFVSTSHPSTAAMEPKMNKHLVSSDRLALSIRAT